MSTLEPEHYLNPANPAIKRDSDPLIKTIKMNENGEIVEEMEKKK